MVRFSGQDRSRSFGCWIEDRRGGAESGEHVAGHHLSVGERSDMVTALREGSGELHPALLKYGIVGIVPAVFRVEIPTAALHGAELHGADGIIQRTEGLARPVIEPARGIVEALPCGEALIADAGGGGSGRSRCRCTSEAAWTWKRGRSAACRPPPCRRRESRA